MLNQSVGCISTLVFPEYLENFCPMDVPLLFKYPNEAYAFIFFVPPLTLIVLSVVIPVWDTIPPQSVLPTSEPSHFPPAQPLAILAQAEGSAVARNISLSLAIVGASPLG